MCLANAETHYMIISFAVIAQINVCYRGYINVIYGAVRLLR